MTDVLKGVLKKKQLNVRGKHRPQRSYLIIALHKVFDLFVYKTRLGIQHVERVRAELIFSCLFNICMY